MNLLSNWKAVLTKAWSIRFIVAAAILSGVEVALPMLEGVFAVPQGLFASLSGLASAAAVVARIFAQPDIAPKTDPAPLAIDTPDEVTE